jgi:hypothetical protein
MSGACYPDCVTLLVAMSALMFCMGAAVACTITCWISGFLNSNRSPTRQRSDFGDDNPPAFADPPAPEPPTTSFKAPHATSRRNRPSSTKNSKTFFAIHDSKGKVHESRDCYHIRQRTSARTTTFVSAAIAPDTSDLTKRVSATSYVYATSSAKLP